MLPPEFVTVCPYGPSGLLIDDIISIDHDANSIVASMPGDFPPTRDQKVSTAMWSRISS